jgi:hypothetical protein
MKLLLKRVPQTYPQILVHIFDLQFRRRLQAVPLRKEHNYTPSIKVYNTSTPPPYFLLFFAKNGLKGKNFSAARIGAISLL